jgi:hypothetical protein
MHPATRHPAAAPSHALPPSHPHAHAHAHTQAHTHAPPGAAIGAAPKSPHMTAADAGRGATAPEGAQTLEETNLRSASAAEGAGAN